jgi:hypothetical protein
VDGNTKVLQECEAASRIYLGWSGEKAQSIPNLNQLIVSDLSVRAARHHLEQIAVGSDRRFRDLSKLQPSHLTQRDGVVGAVDLNFEMMLLWSLRTVWERSVSLNIFHEKPPLPW